MTIQIARTMAPAECRWMGAKYIPTVKDQKASQRFQQKQQSRAKSAQPPVTRPSKPKRSK